MYMKESEKILNSSYDWIVGFTDWMGCSLALLYSTHLIRPKPFGHSTATWLHWRRMDHTPAQRQGPRSENRKTNSNVDERFAQNVRNFTVQHSYKLCEMLKVTMTLSMERVVIFHKNIFLNISVLPPGQIKPTFHATVWNILASLSALTIFYSQMFWCWTLDGGLIWWTCCAEPGGILWLTIRTLMRFFSILDFCSSFKVEAKRQNDWTITSSIIYYVE